VPGNSGIISFLDIQATSCIIVWTAATDDKTSQSDLQYKLLRSTAANISNVTDAEANGTVVLDWAANTTLVTDTGLTAETDYYYNVLVKDEAENVAAYTISSQSTIDGTPPLPGNSGTITASDVSWTSLTLDWTRATDNVSHWSDLTYKVFRSGTPNISTATDAEANGTVVFDWAADISGTTVLGLLPSNTYYFNVVVRDEAANAAAYTMISQASVAERVYWTDIGTSPYSIQSANLDGSQVQGVITTGAWPAHDLEIDVYGLKMYWTDSDGCIRRANLDGTDIEDIITGIYYPHGIALDLDAGKMYWTHSGLHRANLDGSASEFLVDPSTTYAAHDVELDTSAGKMYWTMIIPGWIQRANLDGTNMEDVLTGLATPTGIALDVQAGKIYWTETPTSGTNRIRRANLDGSGAEDLVQSGLRIQGLALDLVAGKIYWTNYATGTIHRANLDGSGVEDLVTGLSAPLAIALALSPSG